jgi:hypothetical protein
VEVGPRESTLVKAALAGEARTVGALPSTDAFEVGKRQPGAVLQVIVCYTAGSSQLDSLMEQ